MLEKRIFKLEALKVLVIDEVTSTHLYFYFSKSTHAFQVLPHLYVLKGIESSYTYFADRFSCLWQVDFMFYSSKQVHSLRKLLTSYSKIRTRQTIFASASIPQHSHFLSKCIQQKWTKVLSSVSSSLNFSLFKEKVNNLLLYLHFPSSFKQSDAVHIHLNPVNPLPSKFQHKFVVIF